MGSCRFLAGCRAGSKRELLRCDLPRAEEEVTQWPQLFAAQRATTAYLRRLAAYQCPLGVLWMQP